MVNLAISGISALREMVASFQPDLVVSITDPDDYSVSSAKMALSGHEGPVLKLAFHDGNGYFRPGEVMPGFEVVEDLCAALDEHMPDGEGNLLVHCGAGSRRSPALALMALTYLARNEEPTKELAARLVDQVMTAAPKCEPNHRLLQMIDYEVEGSAPVVEELLRRIGARDRPRPSASKVARKRQKPAFRA
jgi:predicted protein tyrosine phosphatase